MDQAVAGPLRCPPSSHPPSLLVALLAASVAVATPSLRLGARVSTSGDLTNVVWTDSLGEALRVTYADPYWGPGIEATYGALAWLSARLELVELQFFREGGGALALLPQAGLDVLVEPPLRWRLLPYLWGGMSWTGHWGSQGTPDPRFLGQPFYELRAGLGVRYGLTGRVSLFGETQILRDLSVPSYSPIRGSPQGYRFTGVGLLRAGLGVRCDFGAR
jgi:hypothetical protein